MYKRQPLKIFNANAASWFDSTVHGGAGYNGVMANFHPDLYKWAYDHLEDQTCLLYTSFASSWDVKNQDTTVL